MSLQPRIHARADDAHGVRIFDPIDRQEYSVETPAPVSPVPADPGAFAAPIDAAARIETTAVRFPDVAAVYVRDGAGEMVAEAQHLSSVDLPPPGESAYLVEMATPVKLYLRVAGAFTVTNAAYTEIEFEREEAVTLGARSYHQRPAGTIRTPTDPESLMEAVSYFGSALKTTTCERSYPTLRGHPPLVEPAASFEIPEGLERPSTGVEILVPERPDAVYAVTPLSYYLGASVRPSDGGPARLETAVGTSVRLSDPDVHTAAGRALRQVLTLDCCTRTEGLYSLSLAERRRMESLADLDFSALYDRSLAEQVDAYLSVPWDLVSEIVPEWELRAIVDERAESVRMLPFLADALALVSPPGEHASTPARVSVDPEAIDSFLRSRRGDGGTDGGDGSIGAGESDESSEPSGTARGGASPGGDPPDVRGSAAADEATLAETWIGPPESVPFGRSWTMPAAHRNRLARAETEGALEIAVVVNDPEMAGEGEVVDEAYRGDSPFDVTVYREIDREALADALRSDHDLLHYVGHIRSGGMVCPDGLLDARELPPGSVGVDAFFLNACTSRDQGVALVERGSVAGVVTSSAVGNAGATELGATFARLLDAGFTVSSALNVARTQSAQGHQYSVLGDGRLAISQSESTIPNLLRVAEIGRDRYEVRFELQPGTGDGMGSIFVPHVADNEEYYLCYGSTDPFALDGDALSELLSLQNCPVLLDEKLRWSFDLVD
ncbi:CHAT domain-containing protein [Halegenticoccus soli]|uniref:CHAT domain-containing protein n=1 Tax=Halegenticoccus soli TaxID=1985678 RepID=UPI000C6CED7C|nr:CHAT domain-containing protein [Halegenticoccus soli]